jgi:hypothetical protein
MGGKCTKDTTIKDYNLTNDNVKIKDTSTSKVKIEKENSTLIDKIPKEKLEKNGDQQLSSNLIEVNSKIVKYFNKIFRECI